MIAHSVAEALSSLSTLGYVYLWSHLKGKQTNKTKQKPGMAYPGTAQAEQPTR